MLYLNYASGAALQQWVAAKGRAPGNLFNLFILIYLNCALGATPQQEVAAPDGASQFQFI
jgi:hypothetical protein